MAKTANLVKWRAVRFAGDGFTFSAWDTRRMSVYWTTEALSAVSAWPRRLCGSTKVYDHGHLTAWDDVTDYVIDTLTVDDVSQLERPLRI